MPREEQRAGLCLAILALFAAAFLALFITHGASAFRPPAETTPWISVLSGLCVLALAASLLFFRRGLGIWLENSVGATQTIQVPRRASGFTLAALMATYLGMRAIAVLLLYGRE